MTRASVVIPTYNKAAYLALTLASLERQSTRDFEIIVVDDGSTDDTGAVLSSYAKRLPLRLHRQTNRGRSAARNAAVALAEGDVLIFSDDDRIASPHFVASHLGYFEDGTLDRIVFGWQHGILSWWRRDINPPAHILWKRLSRAALGEVAHLPGPERLMTEDDVRDRLAETVARFAYDEWWWQFVLPVVQAYGDDLEGFDIPWVLGTTGNLSVPRARLIEVGGFDESYRGWGIEDLDICHRLHLAGLKSFVGRQAVNWHQAHPHSQGKWTDWVRNLQRFFDKNVELDVCLYVLECTGTKMMNYVDLNERARSLTSEKPSSALLSAVREACRQVIARRTSTLQTSGAIRFLGWSHDDWS